MPLVEARCAWCGRRYGHVLVEGSTGMCPACLHRLYPDEADDEPEAWPRAVGWSVAVILGACGWYFMAHIALWAWRAW